MKPLKLPLLRVPLQMCAPLILQNKLPLAESFVSGHQRLEEELLAMLDSWCQPGFTADHISRYPGCVCACSCVCVVVVSVLCSHPPSTLSSCSRFPAACPSKHCLDLLQPKMLTKHVFRLMDKFSINPGVCVCLFACVCGSQGLHSSAGFVDFSLTPSFSPFFPRPPCCRPVSQRTSQKASGLAAVPHVRQVCGGESCSCVII